MVGTTLLSLWLALGQASPDGAVSSLACPPAPREIVVDGLLGDWAGLAAHPVVQPEGLSPRDASGEFLVCYTQDALYLAGRILDDHFVTEGGSPWDPALQGRTADAVELFLDLDLEGDRGEAAFNEDDVQLFLMPLNESRRWETWQWRGERGLGQSYLLGLELARNLRPDEGAYEFEVRLPLASLGLYPEQVGSVGFNVAINDSDQDGTPSAYLTLNGESGLYLDATRMVELRFEGEAPDYSVTGSRPLTRLGRGLAGAFGLLLLVGMVGYATLRAHRSWLVRPGPRNVALTTFLTLGALLFLMPTLVQSYLERGARGDLAATRDAVTERLGPLVSQPAALERLRGIDEEGLRDLLEGRRYRPRATYRYTLLDVLGGRPGEHEYKTLRPSGIPVLEYGLPLEFDPEAEARELVRVSLPVPLPAHRVAVALAAFLPDRLPQKKDALEVGFHFQNSAQASQWYTLDDARRPAPPPPGHEGDRLGLARVWESRRTASFDLLQELDGSPLAHVDLLLFDVPDHFHQAEEPARLTEVSFRLDPEVREARVWLSGVSVGEGLLETRWQPAYLGGTDPDGFPMALRPGVDAVRERRLMEGQSTEIRPAPGQSGVLTADRLRIYYRAEGQRSFGQTPEGTTCAVVEVYYRGAEDPQRIPLRLGLEVAEEFQSSERLPSTMTSFTVSSFEGAAGRIHFTGFELPLDNRARLPVERLILRVPEGAGGPFRFAGLTAAEESLPEPLPDNPVFLDHARGGLELKGHEDLFPADSEVGFAVLRGNLVQVLSSGVEPGVAGRLRGTTMSAPTDDVAEVRRELRGGRNMFLTEVALPLSDSPLRLVLLRPLADPTPLLETRDFVAAVLMVLCLPFLLLLLVDLLTRLTRIRTRLSFLFVLTSSVPVTVMFFCLVNVVVSEQGRNEGQRATELLDRAKERIRTLSLQADRQATRILDEVALHVDDPAWMQGELTAYLRGVADESGGGVEVRLNVTPTEDGGEAQFFYSSELQRRDRRWDAPDDNLALSWGEVVFSGRESRGRLQVQVAGVLRDQSFRALGVRPEEGESIALLAPLLADAGSRVEGGAVLSSTRVGTTVPRKEARDAAEDLRRGEERVVTSQAGSGTRVYEMIREDGGGPVAILVAGMRKGALGINLGFWHLDLLWFAMGLGALTLGSALFLGTAVTHGLSMPLVGLRRGLRALVMGQQAPTLVAQGEDEVADLTRSFQQVAGELHRHVADQQFLARTATVLTQDLDLQKRVSAAVELAAEAFKARAVLCYLHDPARDAWVLHSQVGEDFDPMPPERVPAPTGPLKPGSEAQVLWLGGAEQSDGNTRHSRRTWSAAERQLFGTGPLLVAPFGRAGRPTGQFVARVDADPTRTLDPAFLASFLAQTAVALENSRLYQDAVQDPATGLYVHTHFLSRLGEEVDRASVSGESLTLALLHWVGPGELEEEVSPALMQQAVQMLRSACRSSDVVAHRQGLTFEVLLPGSRRERGDGLIQEVALRATEVDGLRRHSLRASVVEYPADGPSREFLLRRLEEQQKVQARPESSGREVLIRLHNRFPEFRFQSPRMVPVLEKAERVASTDATVLILGETGTGKEVLAHLIHGLSSRRQQPFLAVHCAALPEKLIESELFGHEKGAFTGADRRRPGRFEQAHGGTLFLDEVAEIPLELQVKLLRVLQEKAVQRLGGTEELSVDVRLLAATHRPLEELVRAGLFREDLYYRLKVVAIELPPLRDRVEDIPGLVETFLHQAARDGRGPATVEPGALDVLSRHAWPGNVRELRNVIQRALVLGPGDRIRQRDVEFGESVPEDPVLPAAPVGVALGSTRPALPPRQRQLLELLQQVGRITTREMVEKMGVSQRTILRDLSELMDLGLVEREGSRKAASYRATLTRPE